MAASLNPPGPRGQWLLGSLREFRRDMLGYYTGLAREYGDVVAFRLGPHRMLYLAHPDQIEQVLVTENRRFVKHYALRLLIPVLGNGLVTSDGDFWLRQRRLIQPTFQRGRIESYAGVMVEHTERLIHSWEDGQTRDLHADMMQLALGIVSKALLDVDAGDRYGEVSEAIDVILQDFDQRFQSALPMPFWMPTPANRKLRRAVAGLDAIIHAIITARRAEGSDRGDLLSLLVHASNEENQSGMTDRQLRDEVMTLFLAGHETTANAMAWTWYLLASHPEIESRLFAELQSVLAGRAPTVADVPQLVFTRAILDESMRLFPPVYTFGREAIADVELGGYRIPRGTTVLMSQWVTHRDKRFFDRPHEFRPDRWSSGELENLPRYAYFPFAGGPRMCIGNTFALLEATLILATIASKFRMELCPEPTVIPRASVTLRPANGVLCRLRRRRM